MDSFRCVMLRQAVFSNNTHIVCALWWSGSLLSVEEEISPPPHVLLPWWTSPETHHRPRSLKVAETIATETTEWIICENDNMHCSDGTFIQQVGNQIPPSCQPYFKKHHILPCFTLLTSVSEVMFSVFTDGAERGGKKTKDSFQYKDVSLCVIIPPFISCCVVLKQLESWFHLYTCRHNLHRSREIYLGQVSHTQRPHYRDKVWCLHDIFKVQHVRNLA